MSKTLLTITAFLATTAGSALAADSRAGAAVFDKSCKMCHGADGAGNPAMAKMFPTLPNMTTTEFQKKSEEDMKEAVTKGKGKMPASKAVAGADVDNVVAFVRTLRK